MKKALRRVGAMLLAATMTAGLLAGCGGKGTDKEGEGTSKDASFTWWIVKDDSEGTYYGKYEENPAVQWLNAQYWDNERNTLGDEKNGKQVNLSFITPISGSEQDNYNTMIGTGEYPEIINLQFATDTPATLCEDGILMDLTEYVEKYMPNYVQLLDENPDLKNLCTVTDEEGKVHYYALYTIADAPGEAWEGNSYRRDWIVEYAVPTEYVWDWESEYVTQNGHPAVTPLSEAVKQKNMEGWKKNPVTEFTYSEGDDPDNDYEDNVIFPSGKTDPYTISDWEWMMEAFEKAIQAEGFAGNSSSYCITIPFSGCFLTGDLASSFGEGGTLWSVNAEGETIFAADSENFKTYLECMNTWYNNGWLDKVFETRTGDMFWKVNLNGFSQGMVGMQCTNASFLGSTIRTTCTSEFGRSRAMVFGASLPINDVYGTDAQKYHVPDSFYQASRITGKVGLTNKCEGKDLETLFSMFNYLSSEEGCAVSSWGLSKEQYESMSFDPDVYANLNIDCAYSIEDNGDGRDKIVMSVDQSDPASNALRSMRISVGRGKSSMTDEYVPDNGRPEVIQASIENWMAYTATGYLADYDQLLSTEESEIKAKTTTNVTDVINQTVPGLIKNGLDGWDDYCESLAVYEPEEICEIYNQYTK